MWVDYRWLLLYRINSPIFSKSTFKTQVNLAWMLHLQCGKYLKSIHKKYFAFDLPLPQKLLLGNKEATCFTVIFLIWAAQLENNNCVCFLKSWGKNQTKFTWFPSLETSKNSSNLKSKFKMVPRWVWSCLLSPLMENTGFRIMAVFSLWLLITL